MYYLPIKINNRKYHICHLKEDSGFQDEYEEEDLIYQFIVSKNDNERVPILAMLSKTNFISTEGTDDDVLLQDIRHVTHNIIIEKRQATLNLTFEVNHTDRRGKGIQDDEEFKQKLKDIGLEFPEKKYAHYSFFLQSAINCHIRELTLNLNLKKGNKTYSNKTTFHIAPPKKVHEIVFDFGSAASQISIRNTEGNDDARPEAIPIVKRLKRHFFKDDGINKKDVHLYQQYESDSSELFKSIFFIKKENNIEEVAYHSKPNEANQGKNLQDKEYKYDEENDNEFIKILTRNDLQEDFLDAHYQVPNLKLSELVNYFNPNIEFEDASPSFFRIRKDIRRNILNQFIQTALKDIQQGLRKRQRRGNYANITLLVPNIYTQQKVYTLIEDIYKDLAEYCKNYGFVGIQLQAISESDAAFMGMSLTESKKIQTNSNYLVIDAGKGTTDISVVSISREGVFKSMYKGGFPGAGNLINYAFIDTIVAIWTGIEKSKRQEFISKKIIDEAHYLAKTNRLLRMIEAIKRKYGHLLTTKTDKIPLSTFANKIEQVLTPKDIYDSLIKELDGREEKFQVYVNKTIDDYFGYIEHNTNLLCNGIENLLNETLVDINIDGVILAGRAFKFTPFQQELKKRLKNRFGNIEIIYNEAKSKSICIYGATSNQTINFNSNLISLPLIRRRASRKNRTKSFPWQHLFEMLPDVSPQPPAIENISIDDNFFMEGFITNVLSNDISIGMYSYNVNDIFSDVNKKNDKYNIFYTGKEFIVRTNNKTSPIKPSSIGGILDANTWKSIFPFVGEETKQDEIPVCDIDYSRNKKILQKAKRKSRNWNGSDSSLSNDDLDIMDDLLDFEGKQ